MSRHYVTLKYKCTLIFVLINFNVTWYICKVGTFSILTLNSYTLEQRIKVVNIKTYYEKGKSLKNSCLTICYFFGVNIQANKSTLSGRLRREHRGCSIKCRRRTFNSDLQLSSELNFI